MTQDWVNYVRKTVNEHTDIDKLSLRVGKTVYQLCGIDEIIIYTKCLNGNEPGALDMSVFAFNKLDDYIVIGAMNNGVRFVITIYYNDVESVTVN